MTNKLQLNPAEVRKLRFSAGVERVIRQESESVADRAGPGHSVEISRGKTRVRGTVKTETYQAMRAEAKTRNLTRAVR